VEIELLSLSAMGGENFREPVHVGTAIAMLWLIGMTERDLELSLPQTQSDWLFGANRSMHCVMADMLKLTWWAVIGLFRSRASLGAEILTLRHQLNLLRRNSPKRLTFGNFDRFPSRAETVMQSPRTRNEC
jgi:hypothetical protein